LALAAPACGAERLANYKKHRVGRKGGVFLRRLELENRGSALTPSLPRNMPNLRAPVHAYAHNTGANLHISARARSRLHARYTRAQVVSSDLLSRPVSRRSAFTPSFPRHQPTLRVPVDAFARDTSALLHVCARARSRLGARYTRAPVVACARSRVSKHMGSFLSLPLRAHL